MKIFFTMITILTSTSTLSISINNQKTLQENSVHNFANQYENSTIDVNNISYSTISRAVSNSYFLVPMWSHTIKLKMIFESTQSLLGNLWQTDAVVFSYNQQSWHTKDINEFAKTYENVLANEIKNLLTYNLIISIISDIAYYYANNPSNKSDQCIINAFNLIKDMKLIIAKNKDNFINPNGSFMLKLKNFNITNLVSNYEKKIFDPQLEKYRLLDYNLTFDNNRVLSDLDYEMGYVWEHDRNSETKNNNIVKMSTTLVSYNHIKGQLPVNLEFINNFDLKILKIPDPYGGTGAHSYTTFVLKKPSLLDLSF